MPYSTRAARYNPHVTEKPTTTRSWEEEMPDEQVAIFEAVAGDRLSELGYRAPLPKPTHGSEAKSRAGRAGLPIGRLSD